MATYIILNIIFLTIVLLIVVLSGWWPNRTWLIGLTILLILTLAFDSLIIYFEIVGYDTNLITGIYFGKAPIEDFFYTIAAALITPVLWHGIGNRKQWNKR